MKRQDLNERIFDELLKEASADYIEEINSQWSSEEELTSEHTFSADFNKRMEAIFSKKRKYERIIKITAIIPNCSFPTEYLFGPGTLPALPG